MVDPDDAQIAEHLQRIIRRVRSSMQYRGTYSTRDILGSLVARWVDSGEWERLKQLPPGERHLGESVRRFILDRLAQLRRRGERTALDDAEDLVLPDEPTIAELVADAELRAWIATRVEALCRGELDARVRVPLARPVETGEILRLHLEGKPLREIAARLEIALGLVHKRIGEGTQYLVVLQGVEAGLC